MNFNHSDEQVMLADSLRRLLGDNVDIEAQRRIAVSGPGYDPAVWLKLAEVGALGALFSPIAGGYGGSGSDIAVVFEEAGRSGCVSPLLATLLAGSVIASANHAELLEQVIAGETLVAFAHQEPASRYDLDRVETRAAATAGGWSLHGNKAVVAFASAADHLVVSARVSGSVSDPHGIALFLVPVASRGLTLRSTVGFDGASTTEIALDAVEVSGQSLLAPAVEAFGVLEKAVGLGIVASCADAMGALETVMQETAEYLRTRVQFGQAIGSFQALQHRMATMLVEIEQARSALLNAIEQIEAPRVAREQALSAAKCTFGRVCTLVAEEAVQLHGGIGMTWELPLTHFVKRLIMLEHQFGDTDHHLERYISLARAA